MRSQMSFLLFCYPVKFSFHTRQLSLTRIINEHIMFLFSYRFVTTLWMTKDENTLKLMNWPVKSSQKLSLIVRSRVRMLWLLKLGTMHLLPGLIAMENPTKVNFHYSALPFKLQTLLWLLTISFRSYSTTVTKQFSKALALKRNIFNNGKSHRVVWL